VDDLLASAGIDPGTLGAPNTPVPLDRIIELRRLAEARSGDEAFALHAGERIPFGDLGLVDYVTASGATVAEAMSNLSRYFRLVAQGDLRVSFHPGDHGGRVSGEVGRPLPDALRWLERQSMEFTFAALISRIRSHTGHPVRPRLVTFRHEEPRYASEYQRIFQAPIHFMSSENTQLS
jgi:hypothetical protein